MVLISNGKPLPHFKNNMQNLYLKSNKNEPGTSGRLLV
jgi:hypothetical protein